MRKGKGKGKEKNLPDGLNEQALRERADFMRRYEGFLRKTQEIPLSILVWGPNPQTGSSVAKKRNEIREELIRLGHNAMFSEDISIPVGNMSVKSIEFAQARAAHLIVILVEGAPGALGEAHDFCNDPDIAPNIYVLIPKKYKKGYSARGAIKDLSDGYGGVYWYRDYDLRNCNVRKKVMKRVEARRCIVFRSGGTRP